MTRKDYQLIADWFHENVKDVSCCPDHDPTLMANALADRLSVTNPRFDRERFLSACGLK